jgi:outer membrane protein assembly factor BamB
MRTSRVRAVQTSPMTPQPQARAGQALAALALAAAVAACTPGMPQSGAPPGSAGSLPAPVTHTFAPSATPASSATIRAGRATNWLAYHGDSLRSGAAAGLPAAGRLAVGWSRPLDGAVYGQPLVVGGLVIAATENNSVYGLSRSSGQVRWLTHLAAPLPLTDQPCGDINPLGITGTPVFYRRLVYAVAQVGRSGHELVGLDPATGRVRYQREVPSPDHQPYYDQQRGALAAGNGRIYVTFGGHAGDCGPYVGSVVGMPVRSGPIVSYKAPSSTDSGIWTPGGPVINAKGTLFVGVGNGRRSPPYDSSDSVTALAPDLRRLGAFSPVSWLADNRNDLDLGSMTPAVSGSWILIVGKRGIGYLLRARHLGGIGGQAEQLPVCPAFGGAAVVGATVFVPCSHGGMAAVGVPPGRFQVRWRGPPSADGSPVVGGGAVWVTDNSAGVLYQLNAGTGQVMHQIGVGSSLPHFASPSLSGGLVLIGTLHGVVAVTGA